VRAVKSLNEDSFRSAIEAFWLDPSNNSNCIAELCLIADATADYGHGRYKFADIYFSSSDSPVIFELKNASLDGIWRGEKGLKTPAGNDLAQLRETLEEEIPDQLLKRKVCYWNSKDGSWAEKTIESLKIEATQQVTSYMNIMKRGQGSATRAGVYDSRVTFSTGECQLHGYVVICVGGTRVLAWHVKTEAVPHCCLAQDSTEI
jgi:hypothetical protein